MDLIDLDKLGALWYSRVISGAGVAYNESKRNKKMIR